MSTPNLTLPPSVWNALRAVAAVDDTEPDELATMILSRWLSTHAGRFHAASEALRAVTSHPVSSGEGLPLVDALAPEFKIEGDVDPDAVRRELRHELTVLQGTGEPEVPEGGAPGPDRYACDAPGCGKVLKSPQALGGHRAKTGHGKAGTVTPEPEPEPAHEPSDEPEPDRPGARIVCPLCREIYLRSNVERYVDGVPACYSCWVDAGRPA